MNLDVPDAWKAIELGSLGGVIPILGATDVGKSTFARWLCREIGARDRSRRVALLDGDPGQSTLGPPATLSVALDPDEHWDDPASTRRVFVGSTSPRGHFLEILTGAQRLAQYARESGADTVIYDGSGLIDPRAGGVALKWAELELFRPSAVFAIQRTDELEPLLTPLRHGLRTELHILRPSPAARRRKTEARRQHRARQYARHFVGARPLELPWSRLAVLPAPRFHIHQLVGLEDDKGFLLALGIVLAANLDARYLKLLTPLPSVDEVRVLKLGDVRMEPVSFRDTIEGGKG